MELGSLGNEEGCWGPVPGLKLMEMERTRGSSLCCGGGGGRFWTETVVDERFSNMRLEEALRTSAELLVTGCPFCVLNFEDSAKAREGHDAIGVQDVTELLV